MKKKLSFREYLSVASMLFGMFFGAGNLIFPVSVGQLAGSRVWIAAAGLLITGVGLPLLGVAALGVSRAGGLYELSGRVGKPYGLFFTCLLYLTIGPFFAIPRCATTSFTVGLAQILPQGGPAWAYLLGFSALFFGAALFFSLHPGKILTWIGRILNPAFLVFLATLLVVALSSPAASVSTAEPVGDYAVQPFLAGFLEGYNTMDALASLAFGIIVVRVIHGLGVKEPGAVAGCTVRSGVFSCLLMGLIYLAVAIVGAQSRGLFTPAENGGIALAQIAQHYLGDAGLLLLAVTVTLACLKTAVGLLTSCAETFAAIFPKGPCYRLWVILFCVVSFLLANLGLSAIISYSAPVLMFLYPLSIVLILLTLFGRCFGYDRAVYAWAIGLTLPTAFYDLLCALPEYLHAPLKPVLDAIGRFLPLSSLGLGWLCPAAFGLCLGLLFHFLRRKKV